MLRSLGAATVLLSLFVAASVATIGTMTGCSSSSSGGGSCDTGGADGGTCNPPTSSNPTPAYTSCATLTSPTVSFSKDIVPTFNDSCGVSNACHQPPANPAVANLVLGLPDGGVPAEMVIQAIVGKSALENPNMEIVKAGDPENSFLMHKVDGDQCLYAATCNKTGNPIFNECGVQMPYNSGVIDTATRDNIRRWIAQGAQNN
ncbi:MAG TPA: hypothetical protein VMI75_39375 [Polyangiaceae bacterium]|nr:hypothetical protein [Polyangiaceae bacterium]